MTHRDRMASLGLTLPKVVTPIGSYVPALQVDSLVFTSGQLPMRDGKLICAGKVGAEVPLEQAAAAAEQAALNAVAAVVSLVGDIDRIERVVRVCVYVASAPGFTDQPTVANGGSDLLTRIFGDAGRHVRSAVGVSELPLNASVEIELLVRTLAG